MTDNIITQVTQETFTAIPQYEETGSVDYSSKINLNVRGTEFTITRDELMSLPESILLCLFPNGVFLDADGQVISNLTEQDVVYVNFDPQCFQYIVDVFGAANIDLERMSALAPQTSGRVAQNDAMNVLRTKPAIIVLREDLDYYVVPPVSGLKEEQMRYLKLEVASHLLANKFVFSGLGYDVDSPADSEQNLGPAEKHLFDMLCSSGFNPQGLWGNRSIEPARCVILSLALVRLKTDTPTPPESPGLNPVTSNASTASRSRSRIATLASNASRAASRSLSRRRHDTSQSKLLLFWRKPARKCWWSNETIELAVDLSKMGGKLTEKTATVKIHIRRVWTLELSVVGVQ